jgi:hypothetical protein
MPRAVNGVSRAVNGVRPLTLKLERVNAVFNNRKNNKGRSLRATCSSSAHSPS